MAETGAEFAGEHSGHYYFKGNFRADSGIIAALIVLEYMSMKGVKLSELREIYDVYSSTGEVNYRVRNQEELLKVVEQQFRNEKPIILTDLRSNRKTGGLIFVLQTQNRLSDSI